MNVTQQREPSPKGDRRRTQIIETAMALFGESGYRGASLRDIATRVGITHPGLLYHFHSKEELLMEVLARRDEQTTAQLVSDELHTPAQRLQAVVEMVRHNVANRGLVELFSTLSAEATDPGHPAHDYFVERYRIVARYYCSLFADAAAEGLLRDGVDPELAGRGMVALLDGLQVQWLYEQDALDMVASVAAHLDGLLVRPLDELEGITQPAGS